MRRFIRKIQQSLALKLSFGIMLLALPIFFISLGGLFLQSGSYIKNEAKEHAMSVLNTTLNRVQLYLGTVVTATEANAWNVKAHFEADSLMAYTARIVIQNPDVCGCSITPEPNWFPQYGKFFSAYTIRQGDSILTVREGEYNYYEKPWYTVPRDMKKACWIDPFDDYNEGTLSATEMIASYCKPLYDDSGQLMGVIATDLSHKFLADVINTEKPYPNAYFVMLGKNGHYFVHPDSTLLVNSTIFDNPNPEARAIGHELHAGKEGMAEICLNDNPSLICYKNIPGTEWKLLLVCPERDILRSYNNLHYIVTALIIFGLILIMLFIHWIVNHMTRPLTSLLKQTKNLEAGKFYDRISKTNRRDVIGRLQNSFSIMQQSLEQHVNNIHLVNAEMEQRNEELARANQMVEEAARQKTTFIQNVTHQIRTPLNVILGGAQVMRDNADNLAAEEQKELTSMMDHHAKTLSRMILMLYVSSEFGHEEELRAKQLEEVSCNELVRECISYFQQHFPGVPVDFKTSLPDTFLIRTNHLYLMRSLREIFYNSGKYSDGQHISVNVSSTGETVHFVFEDTGSGIAAKDRKKLFTPFSKVNDLSEGLGLGLYLSNRHITNLKGSLTIDPDYHAGCRIIIDLPRQI